MNSQGRIMQAGVEFQPDLQNPRKPVRLGVLLMTSYGDGVLLGRRGLDLVEPRKVVPVIELDLGEPREEVLAGLLEVDPLAARQNVERIPEASGGAPLDESAGDQPLPEIG